MSSEGRFFYLNNAAEGAVAGCVFRSEFLNFSSGTLGSYLETVIFVLIIPLVDGLWDFIFLSDGTQHYSNRDVFRYF